jgi:hypothetical protein
VASRAIDTIPPPARILCRASGGKIEALKTLLDSARAIVDDLADGSMERALRALADLPAQERGVIALALDRAVTAWRANEAFAPLHRVQMRANPHAQLFVRVFDPVPALAFEQSDILPETLRIMNRPRSAHASRGARHLGAGDHERASDADGGGVDELRAVSRAHPRRDLGPRAR